MNKIKFYCVTNKKINFIDKKNYFFGWVGRGVAPNSYIRCNENNDIYHKEKYYSELTFHYWFWKNQLQKEKNETWIGFCQKRRYWVKNYKQNKINKKNINDFLLSKIDDQENIESVICSSINTCGVNKMKLIKRGWKNIILNPMILFKNKHQNIELHFDMHHGHGNLQKAIKLVDKNDRKEFLNYVKKNTKFNPNIMFISKKKIIDKWFKVLFEWLNRCEKEFGFKNLKGYDQTRLYAYLAERYLSFWFKKYTKYKEYPWIFIDV